MAAFLHYEITTPARMMPETDPKKQIPLPKLWPETVKSAVLQVISLAQFAAAHTRGWAANSVNARIRLTADNDRLKAVAALLREELRIKDARMREINPHHRPKYPPSERMAILERENHVWHVDLTVMPTAMGLCCSWLPLALPQRWPLCYWLAVAVDHFSRRVMGCTAMKENPTSQTVRAFLGRAIAKAKKTPKYIICDRGQQFDCQGFRDWCRRKGIQPPRYGAVGKHGSIAVVERFILSLKTVLSALLLIPYSRDAFQRELDAVIGWYNESRPHTWVGGKTPDEVYHGRFAANRKPRLEPRSRWPRGSACARPWALVRGSPGARFELQVAFHKGRRHLPVVAIVPAA
jgi:putative transposase